MKQKPGYHNLFRTTDGLFDLATPKEQVLFQQSDRVIVEKKTELQLLKHINITKNGMKSLPLQIEQQLEKIDQLCNGSSHRERARNKFREIIVSDSCSSYSSNSLESKHTIQKSESVMQPLKFQHDETLSKMEEFQNDEDNEDEDQFGPDLKQQSFQSKSLSQIFRTKQNSTYTLQSNSDTLTDDLESSLSSNHVIIKNHSSHNLEGLQLIYEGYQQLKSSNTLTQTINQQYLEQTDSYQEYLKELQIEINYQRNINSLTASNDGEKQYQGQRRQHQKQVTKL
eukprot:403377262